MQLKAMFGSWFGEKKEMENLGKDNEVRFFFPLFFLVGFGK